MFCHFNHLLLIQVYPSVQVRHEMRLTHTVCEETESLFYSFFICNFFCPDAQKCEEDMMSAAFT